MLKKSKKFDDTEVISDEDKVITEENFDEINNSKQEKKPWFKKLFKKKDKQVETQTEATYKKPLKERFTTFFKLFISFGLTIVLTALVSILIFDAIDRNNEKKAAEERAAYLKTVYQIGSIDVPSFENLTGKAPIDITNKKKINIENPNESTTYTSVYDNKQDRDNALNSYISKLKSENFAIIGDSIVRTFDEQKTSMIITYTTTDAETEYTLAITYSIDL